MSLAASLFVVEPDGRAILINSSSMSARYGQDPYTARLVRPDEIRDYAFQFPATTASSFVPMARMVPAGSRIVLVIAPPRGAEARINYGTGDVVGNEDARRARTQVLEVFQDGAHASYLDIGTEPGASGAATWSERHKKALIDEH